MVEWKVTVKGDLYILCKMTKNLGGIQSQQHTCKKPISGQATEDNQK